MTHLKISIFSIFFLMCSTQVFAGVESHGGGAYVCRDQNGQILNQPLSVELMDLWEAETFLKLNVQRDGDSSALQIANQAFDRLHIWDPQLWQQTVAAYSGIINHMVPVPAGVTLSKPDDAGTSLQKANCPLESVAAYNDDSGTLFFNPEVYNAMSPADQAALMVHEAIYKVRRTVNQDQNSVEARRDVGFIFSSDPIPSVDSLPNPLPANTLFCQTDSHSYAFTLTRTPSNLQVFPYLYHFRFMHAGNRPLLGLAETSVGDMMPWVSDLFAKTNPNIAIGTEIGPSSANESIGNLYPSSNFETLKLSLGVDPRLEVLRCRSN